MRNRSLNEYAKLKSKQKKLTNAGAQDRSQDCAHDNRRISRLCS